MSDRVIFILVGIVFAAGLFALIGCEIWKWRRWPKASATVLRYVTKHRRNHGRSYAPVVRFQTPEGNQIVAISAHGTWRRPWERGDSITVRYNPTRTHCCEPATFGVMWGPILSCLAMLIAIAMFWMFWPNR